MTRKGGASVGLIGLSLASLIAASQAQAQAQTTYPAALDGATLDAWLQQSTDLRPDQVVAVSPSALFAVVSLGETRAQPREVTLRAEALTPDAVARSGVLAWEMQLQVNCKTGQVHVGETKGYAARAPDGHPIPLAPAEPDWRRPNDGTAIASVWRQVCQGAATPAPAPSRTQAAQQTKAPPPPRPLATLLRPALRASGRAAAQVVSSPQESDARGALSRLRTRFAAAFAQLDTRIEPAQVGGRTVYRGVVIGFASRGDAAAFCETLKRRGQDCLAR